MLRDVHGFIDFQCIKTIPHIEVITNHTKSEWIPLLPSATRSHRKVVAFICTSRTHKQPQTNRVDQEGTSSWHRQVTAWRCRHLFRSYWPSLSSHPIGIGAKKWLCACGPTSTSTVSLQVDSRIYSILSYSPWHDFPGGGLQNRKPLWLHIFLQQLRKCPSKHIGALNSWAGDGLEWYGASINIPNGFPGWSWVWHQVCWERSHHMGEVPIHECLHLLQRELLHPSSKAKIKLGWSQVCVQSKDHKSKWWRKTELFTSTTWM